MVRFPTVSRAVWGGGRGVVELLKRHCPGGWISNCGVHAVWCGGRGVVELLKGHCPDGWISKCVECCIRDGGRGGRGVVEIR